MASLFVESDGFRRNCVRGSRAESWEHFSRKCELAYWCLVNGKEFLTEARLKLNGRRADFVILDDGVIVEVETRYPVTVGLKEENYRELGVDVVVIPASVPFREEMLR